MGRGINNAERGEGEQQHTVAAGVISGNSESQDISQSDSRDDVKKCYTLCKILKSFWQHNRYKIILLIIFVLLFGYNAQENLNVDSKLQKLQAYMKILGGGDTSQSPSAVVAES